MNKNYFWRINFLKVLKVVFRFGSSFRFSSKNQSNWLFLLLFWDPLYICMYVGLYDYMLNIISLINKYVWCFSILNKVGIFLLFPVSDIKYKNISISVDLSTQQKIQVLNFIWIDFWKKANGTNASYPNWDPSPSQVFLKDT